MIESFSFVALLLSIAWVWQLFLEFEFEPITMPKKQPKFTIANCTVHNPIRVFPDGNKWCALLGEDLQNGISAFADTPDEAVARLAGETGENTLEQWIRKPL